MNFLNDLGFKKEDYAEFLDNPVSIIFKAKDSPDTSSRADILFVYSDIVREHHVGDVMADSFRAVPLARGDDKFVSAHTFAKPYYFPIRFNRIESISILINDVTGAIMRFKHGRTLVTLHFRKII